MANQRRYGCGEGELRERIDRYFRALEEDPTRRGGPSDLLAWLEMDMATASRMARETSGTYRGYGELMRSAATRLRAHLETSPAWAGSNGSKSMFLIKQQLWDGQSYSDKRDSGPANTTVRVVFGTGKHSGEAFE